VAARLITLNDFQVLCSDAQKETIECLEVPNADHDLIDKVGVHFRKLDAFIKTHLAPSM